jgi:hypothetical protein
MYCPTVTGEGPSMPRGYVWMSRRGMPTMRALLNVVDLLDHTSAELGDKGDMRRTSRFTTHAPCRRIGPGRRVQLWDLELSERQSSYRSPVGDKPEARSSASLATDALESRVSAGGTSSMCGLS